MFNKTVVIQNAAKQFLEVVNLSLVGLYQLWQ
jgi:hypothetical protein